MRNSTSAAVSVSIYGANVMHSNDIFMICEAFIHPVYADCKLLLVSDNSALISHYPEKAIPDNASTDLLEDAQDCPSLVPL